MRAVLDGIGVAALDRLCQLSEQLPTVSLREFGAF
jgi:hypothetical protein